jgi:hypothetical protein
MIWFMRRVCIALHFFSGSLKDHPFHLEYVILVINNLKGAR